MPLTTSLITGRIPLPNNAASGSTEITFTLNGMDTEGDNALPPESSVRYRLTANGEFPADAVLWQNLRGLRGTSYRVNVIWVEAVAGRPVTKTAQLGYVQIGMEPSYSIGDLLASPAGIDPAIYVNVPQTVWLDFNARLDYMYSIAESSLPATVERAVEAELAAKASEQAAAASAQAAAVSATQAVEDVNEARDGALTAISTAEGESVSAVEDAGAAALALINPKVTEANNAASNANAARDSALAAGGQGAVIRGVADTKTLPFTSSTSGIGYVMTNVLAASNYASDAGGVFLRRVMDAGWRASALRQTMAHKAGNVYRMSVRYKVTGDITVRLNIRTMDGTGTQTGDYSGGDIAATAADGIRTASAVFGRQAGGLVTHVVGTDAIWNAAVGMRFNFSNNAVVPAAGTELHVYEIIVEDVTLADAAARSATAASGSATTAGAAATAADGSAQAAAGSALAAEGSAGEAAGALANVQASSGAAAASEANALASEVAARSSETAAAGSAGAASASAAAAESARGAALSSASAAALSAGSANDAYVATQDLMDEFANFRFLGKVEWWAGSASHIPAGFLPLNGQLLNRVDYPDIWEDVSNGVFISVTDALWLNSGGATIGANRAKFSLGDGTTTFRLPDLNGVQTNSLKGLYLRGSQTADGVELGRAMGDVIRNIISGDILSGTASSGYQGFVPNTQANSALYTEYWPPAASGLTDAAVGQQVSGQSRHGILKLNAARVVPTGPENRPVSAVGTWIMLVNGAPARQFNPETSAGLGSNAFGGKQSFNAGFDFTGVVPQLIQTDVDQGLTDAQKLVAAINAGAVSYAGVQSLTAAQRNRANQNSGSLPYLDDLSTVITAAQKAIARKNVGLGTPADISVAGQLIAVVSFGEGFAFDFRTANANGTEIWRCISSSLVHPSGASADQVVSYGMTFLSTSHPIVTNGDATAMPSLMLSTWNRTNGGFAVTARQTDGSPYTGAYRINYTIWGRTA